MADVLTPEQRRRNMSRIQGRNTSLEMLLRRGLHARGLRYRLHRKNLPGCPDIVFPKYRVCMFVHGCFWHGHDCKLFRMPTTNVEFWEKKIARNRERDRQAVESLLEMGWQVLVLWECAVRKVGRRNFDEVLDQCINFIRSENSNKSVFQVSGFVSKYQI